MTPASKPLRLFVAVPVDEALRAQARGRIEELAKAGGDVRWAAAEGLHLTLRFLGSQPPRLLDPLRRAVDAVASAAKPFELAFDRLDYFGRRGRPDVIWAGTSRGGNTLIRLAAALDAAFAQAGIPREGRPFQPHLTLGRARSHDGLRPLSQAIAGAAPLDWRQRVDRLVLYSSALSGAGAVHTALHERPLG
jgi:2'-5' RNA ligase